MGKAVSRRALARSGAGLAALAGLAGHARATTPWLRDQVVVYADSTLAPVLGQLAVTFWQNHRAQMHVFTAPPRQQIELLAHDTQCDLLITLPDFLQEAQTRGLARGEITDLWRGRLVFAGGTAATPAPFDRDGFLALTQGKRLAIPDANPGSAVDGAGVLASLGLNDALAGRVIAAHDSTEAAAMLRDGSAAFALVQASDARANPALPIAYTVPDEAHPPISFGAVMTARSWSRNLHAAIAHLCREDSRRIAAAGGLEPIGLTQGAPA